MHTDDYHSPNTWYTVLMKILLIEPYFTGSHEMWARDYQRHSQHQVKLLTLPGRHWKWRMHGAAIELAEQMNALTDSGYVPDLLLVSDMLDLTTFKALTNKRFPCALYFHENQLSYPYTDRDTDSRRSRDFHYGFINYTSALAADRVYFNSKSQMNAFYSALESLLNALPDFNGTGNLPRLKSRTAVLPLGISYERPAKSQNSSKEDVPLILWSHRWEYDKNPVPFFNALYTLSSEGHDFKLAVLGASSKNPPGIFKEAEKRLSQHIVAFGKPNTRGAYLDWLDKASLLPVTSHHETFGISVMEAIHQGTVPILPRRLSYPELIPPEDFPDLYYDRDDELTGKIRDFLQGYPSTHQPELTSYAAQYDWKHVAKLYDSTFEKI